MDAPIGTGLSDFHKMTISVLKMHFHGLPPRLITYGDFKKFDNERFMNSLQSLLFDSATDHNINDPDLVNMYL